MPDIDWVVNEPHSFFAGRVLRTCGMCGYWDMSMPTSHEDGTTWLMPGVQHAIVDVFGDRRVAVLKDTARIVIPHVRHSRLDDPASRSVVISLNQTPLQSVQVRAVDEGRGDISMRGLLALVTPLSTVDLGFGSSFDARYLQTFHRCVSAHRANSVFFHEHSDGPPPCLLLVLSVQYGAYPARISADFAYETIAAILLDDGSPGQAGSIFCHTGRLSREMLAFVGHAFETSAAYQSFCKLNRKDVRVEIVDSDTEERIEFTGVQQNCSDEHFKQLVAQVEAQERRERSSERERWRLRLREITGLLNEPLES